ncbi:Tn7-like element transposition protein TnsE [Clostridium scatologenes]|uniref:TnsE C-terminal domain-containing protein n=1 Tax=Clostridium scatologenes TaxID=1548 RepID=A0A0E3K3B9_CLOSL|nr:Tn7-like element transposition protein TnsE [Clostridium scatologenes]AKA71489.1 hypothetical protein CSCA_4364 [Clostridium scatologenes]
MSKKEAKVKEWPFEKGERVKLTWIGEPFKQNNKWVINSYFKGNRNTRKVILDWGSVHFLVTEKYYVDGDLNNSEAPENSEIIELNLKVAKTEYRERPWEVWGSGFKDKTKSKIFSFIDKGELYIIPIIEIIRAVLAPSKFMLNRILEMDAFDNYFTYDIDKRKLEIHFTYEYEQKLLKTDKINHLAWLLTNTNALKMFNKVGQNVWQLKELKFDFLLENFNIRVRIEKKNNYTKILEILALKRKKINVEEVNVYHPSLEETQSSNEAKIRKYINKNSNSDRELTSEGDGSTKTSEEINDLLIEHEYEILPQINKKKKGFRVARKAEDENTKKYILEDNNLRTTADVGGEDVIRGLEFTSIDKVEEKGELAEFVEVLKFLEKREDIKKVNIIIGELPEGKRGKRFARLSDGVTKRKYTIGQVTMSNGREFSLIDVEREGKVLSMLMLRSDNNVNWNLIYSKLLFGLVDESGKWNNETINNAINNRIIIERIKHINRRIDENLNFLYSKLFLWKSNNI